MKNALLIATLCLATFPAAAQEFWGHRVDVDFDVAYGEDPLQVADVYLQGTRPAPGAGFEVLSEPRPTLIWYHGGGWVGGDKAGSINRIVHYLERGWHVVNVNYRIGQGTAPEAVDDAMCAYKWVVDEAQRTGRSDRFVVSGSSAGGQLALVVGLLNASGDHPCKSEVVPEAIVNWYGITDIQAAEAFSAAHTPDDNFSLEWIGDRARIADISARFSPQNLVSDTAPPIITIHGTADDTVPYEQAPALHAKLTTRNQLISLEGGTHGGFSDAQYDEAMAAVFAFLGE